MRHAASFLVVAALMLAPAAFAADTASSAKDGKPGARSQAEELRPSGPVTVKADRAEWVQNNQMKYSGNVSMSSDTLVVHGDSMEVHQAPDGQFEAWVHGKPATIDHAADPDDRKSTRLNSSHQRAPRK